MPTWRNDNTDVRKVEDSKGREQYVRPGAYVVSNHILSEEGFTQTSAAPYYNPVLSVTDVTFSSSGDNQTVTIDHVKAKTIHIASISDTLQIDVHIDSASHTPPILSKIESAIKQTYTIDTHYKIRSLVLVPTAAGSCKVYQSEE